MSLIDKARKMPTSNGRIFTQEEIDLALAWVGDEVTLGQITKAIGQKNPSTNLAYSFVSRALKQYINEKK